MNILQKTSWPMLGAVRRLIRDSANVSLIISLVTATCNCSGDEAKTTTAKPASGGMTRAAVAFARASEAEETKNWEECLKQAEAALQDDPDHVAARMRAAWACWNLEQYDKAASLYAKVGGSFGDNARMWRAHSLAAVGNWSDAQQAFADRLATDALINWAPFSLPGSEKTDNERCVLYWKKVAKANPKSTVALWLLGNTYAGSKRWEEALAAYAEALKITPKWPPAVVASAMAQSYSGHPDEAQVLLDALLKEQPRHVEALWARMQVAAKQGDGAATSSACLRLAEVLGHRISINLLVQGAQTAWRSGQSDAGIRLINSAVDWAGEYCRVSMVDSDEQALADFGDKRTLPPTDVLGRYALASALFGRVDALLNAAENVMIQGMQAGELTRVNTPTPADVARYGADAANGAEEAAKRFDIGTSMVLQMRATLLPHLGRCVRELEATLKNRPDFDAAKVLLAEVHHYAGNDNQARKLLEEVLAAKPDATSVRLRISQWSPLDKAQDLMEAVPTQDAALLRVMLRRANLERDAGDFKACARQALAILRERGAYWDVFELLGIALDKTGDRQSALACLEYSTKHGRTVQGALTIAKLREKLNKPGVTEALIDAWRAAPNGTPEETETRELLRGRNTASFVCQRCGGSGSISEISGTIVDGGSIQTSQTACPQCQGLGLWYPNVH